MSAFTWLNLFVAAMGLLGFVFADSGVSRLVTGLIFVLAVGSAVITEREARSR